MRISNFLFVAAAFAAAVLMSEASAEPFSTSALNPTPMPADGIISSSYPPGAMETSYYFVADLKAGELVTQISFMGRPGADKFLTTEPDRPGRGSRPAATTS